MIRTAVFGLAALAALLLASPPFAEAITISYQAIDLADPDPFQDLRQYQYQVSSFDFPQDWGFDIFFPLAQGYQWGDLLEPLLPPNSDWDVLALQPDASLSHDGRYDAVALVDHPSLNGCFTQTVIWRGIGTPGAQPFEVFDDNFQAQVGESGATTPASFTCPAVVEAPEPSALWLLGIGLLGLVWSRTKPSRNSSRSGTGRARHAPS